MKTKVIVFRQKLNVYEFHIRQRLTEYPEYYDGPGDVSPENYEGGFKNHAYLLAKEIFLIAGIQLIMISGYVVEVEISWSYSWEKDKIRRSVLNVIQKYVENKLKCSQLLIEAKKSSQDDSR